MYINKKKSQVIENNVKYVKTKICIEKSIYCEIWTNENNKIDRNGLPAIIFKKNQKIMKEFYFKNGEIHSYNNKPSIYIKQESFNNILEHSIWTQNNKIHREGKPAIISKRDGYKVFYGFFLNNISSINKEGSLVHYDVDDNFNLYKSKVLFLKNNIGCNGYNYFLYNKDNSLYNKKRTELSIEKIISYFTDNINNIDFNSVYDNPYILNFISYMIHDLIKTEFQIFSEEDYHQLPQSISINKSSNEIVMEWRQKGRLHRDKYPAKITIQENTIINEYISEGRPLNSLYKPSLTHLNRKNKNVVKFEFHNKKIEEYYKEFNLNPFLLMDEDIELINLNFQK